MRKGFNRVASIGLITLGLSASAAQAQGLLAAMAKPKGNIVATSVEEKSVLSGKETLDATAGYILVTSPLRQIGTFLRQPDEESRAAWETERQAAFVKEHRHWASAMVTWRTEAQIAANNKAKPPEQPVEPKIETFVHAPLELRDMVQFGPSWVYTKGTTFTYLEKVKPGTYVWYGNVMGGNGLPAGGMCLCMGTVSFEVKPGVVTDLGNSLWTLPHWGDETDVQRLEAKQAQEKRAAEGKAPAKTIELGALAYGLPASLKDWPSVQAELHASPKTNNYFGIYVSRLAPIPGVLGYHRDVVVDERTGQELASPTLVSRQKPKL